MSPTYNFCYICRLHVQFMAISCSFWGGLAVPVHQNSLKIKVFFCFLFFFAFSIFVVVFLDFLFFVFLDFLFFFEFFLFFSFFARYN